MLLDKAAVCDLGGMKIECAYWDAETQSLVLVSQEGDTLAGPTLDMDHLHVALRAAFAGEPLGVSIDPPAEYRHRTGATPPPGSPMYVSYLGATRGTAFGAIMFEADRVLKCLTKGLDNETGRPYRVDVPGFRTLLERMCAEGDSASGSWHRFWFVIDNVSLAVDRNSKTLRFDDVRMKVLNECELGDGSGAATPSPCDEDFVKHLTEHFDLYASHVPSLARLKELARITALAQYLVGEGVAIDLSALFGSDPMPAHTPDETPAIVATGDAGGGSYLKLVGGVDLDALPTISEITDEALTQLRNECERTRPARNAHMWRTAFTDKGRLAIAVPLGRPPLPYTADAEDHRFANGRLFLRRHYDSSDPTPGDFGPGWRIAVPYRLTPVEPSRKRAETEVDSKPEPRPRVLILHDLASGKAMRFRRVKGHKQDEVYARLTYQAKTRDGVAYDVASGDTILIDGDGYCLRRGNTSYRFAADGYLRHLDRAGGESVVYDWDGPLLRSISNRNGNQYVFDRDTTGRVVRVDGSDGAFIEYSYDPVGLLATVRREGAGKAVYRYDAHGRLTEIRDHSGKVVRRTLYDQSGNANGSGVPLDRRIEHDRVLSVSDRGSWHAEYAYAEDGSIRSVELHDGRRPRLTLTYDESGRLCRVSEPTGECVEVEYDGRFVRQLTWADGSRMRLEAESGKPIVSVEDARGERWQAIAGAAGLLSEIRGPQGRRIRVTRRRNKLSLRSPAGKWSMKQLSQSVFLKAEPRGGQAVEAKIAPDRVDARTRGRPAQRSRLKVSSQSRDAVLEDAAGTVRWAHDAESMSVRVSIEWA